MGEHLGWRHQGKNRAVKVADFKKILVAAGDFYRAQGNERIAEALMDFARLAEGQESKTVDRLVKEIDIAYKSTSKN
jgi:hypothetical protein